MSIVLSRYLYFPLAESLKGTPVAAALRELERTQWLQEEKLRDLGWAGLAEILEMALRDVPFYEEQGASCGAVTPGSALEVLERLPVLSREDVDRRAFVPVLASVAVMAAFHRENPSRFAWRQPPFEYEHDKMPIDILAGSPALRRHIEAGTGAREIAASWETAVAAFEPARKAYLLY